MKCEIIDGKFHIEAGTPTEQWALTQLINSMGRYDDPNNFIVDAAVAKRKIAPQIPSGLIPHAPAPQPVPVPQPSNDIDDSDIIF